MDELKHYGVSKRDGARVGSGRYPLGSGSNPSRGAVRKAKKIAAKNSGSQQKRDEYWTKQNVKAGKDKAPISRTEQTFGKVKSGTDAARDITRIAAKYDKKTRPHPEVAEMSNKELQDAINRMNLEKQYANLVDGDIKSGWEKAGDILEVFGDVITVAGSAASIYLIFKGAQIL